MQCRKYYYYLYLLTAVNTAQCKWSCGYYWWSTCPPPIEGLLSLKGDFYFVKSNEETFLHATCLAVMEIQKPADMFWSMRRPAGGVPLNMGCKVKKYDLWKNENTCTLELKYSTYYVGYSLTCHAGATLDKALFKFPSIDSWKPSMTTGLNDTIEYNMCEKVHATCAIDTAHTDYTLQWLLFDGTNTTLLASNTKRKFSKSKVTLNQNISSKHDKSKLFCRCWHSRDGVPAVCGEYHHELNLVPETCFNETDRYGASTIRQEVDNVDMSRDSHLLTIWLTSGVIMITMIIVGTVAIFCCQRSRIRKSQDKNILKNIELNELYAQPVRKSQRGQRAESDVYALSPDENDPVYVYSVFEDDCHTYGNFPILISAGTRPSNMSEPTYVNA